MSILKKPKAIIIHLKRFKIDNQTLRYSKLSYRIPFPNELRIEDSIDDQDDESGGQLYHLKGIGKIYFIDDDIICSYSYWARVLLWTLLGTGEKLREMD